MINYLKNLKKITTFLTLAFFSITVNPLAADNHSNFKQVEATGRAILLENDINGNVTTNPERKACES